MFGCRVNFPVTKRRYLALVNITAIRVNNDNYCPGMLSFFYLPV